jgi:hypothetical protein
MAEPIIACVRGAHSLDTVAEFRDAVARNINVPYTLVCFTDQPQCCDAVNFLDITGMGLPGEWGRLMLFEPSWREQSMVIYFDLDLAIIGDITPLTTVPGEFATTTDQSVMVIGGGMAGFVWTSFAARQEELMRRHGTTACISALYRSPPLLRHLLPRGFFTKGCVGLP